MDDFMTGYVGIGHVSKVDHTKPLCEAADSAPGVWGHKCGLNKGHGRKINHRCGGCGHSWSEPREPDTSKVRTVGGDLTL